MSSVQLQSIFIPFRIDKRNRHVAFWHFWCKKEINFTCIFISHILNILHFLIQLWEWINIKFGHGRIPCNPLPQQGQTTGAKCHVVGYNDCCVIAVLDSFSVQLCVHKNLKNKLKLFSLQNSVLRINKNLTQ